MAVPKKKTTRSKKKMRRLHDKLKKVNISTDKKSGEQHLYHHITRYGYYKNKKYIFKKCFKNY
ncbi:50S ribosomal protein L32 [Candidatus Annandia adelgestsuga]|uniref:Large ribosomal subunit protein bL32 n=2 Tax=Candidatus Annandia adelgestsuga TaxID=1302411 RepID=A0A3Q9CPH2_9ENTR|nr:50S ribosomal protein L32 [Candidatus Annandia adelgestsuga]AZP36408.1 50S ribosomal protein L32 [Candidatus Annandia adelgestsuga]